MTSDFLADLARRGISPETGHAHVRAITSEEARTLGFAFNGYAHADLSGVAFDYRDPHTKQILLTRIRPNVPVDGRKYLQPPGSENHLYVPDPLKEHLSDVRFAAVFTEGEFKALALKDASQHRHLIVGIGGVWNWRTSDKEKQPNRDNGGSHQARVNSRPIADFEWITWRGRTVYILFDSDAATKDQVQAAERALCEDLRRRGAVPRVVVLPSGKDGEKRGIDDLLAEQPAAQRLAYLERLLRSAEPQRRAKADAESALDLVFEPPGGFLRSFDEYVDPITDAPAIYRPFVALNILSAIVGRNVTARFGFKNIVLNLYQVILGPSSLFRKSTMIDLADFFVSAAKPDIVLPNEVTPERLLKLLETSPQGLFLWRELTGFLARASRDYMGGLREILMELYDAPPSYRRELQSGRVSVANPSLTILAASATSWLSDSLKSGDLRSGFLNRFTFVLADKKTKWYAIPPAPDGALRSRLLSQLRKIGEIKGEADLSIVQDRYTAWLRDHERQILQSEHQEVLGTFLVRLSIVALKYAVLLELATTGSLQVRPSTLEEALVLIDYQKAVIAHLLRTELAPSESGKRTQRVAQVISQHPGCLKKHLLQRTGFLARELDPILETLIARDEVYVAEKGYWLRG